MHLFYFQAVRHKNINALRGPVQMTSRWRACFLEETRGKRSPTRIGIKNNPGDNYNILVIVDCVNLLYTGEWNDRPFEHQNVFIFEIKHF